MKKILLLLAKGFEIYEASVFIDVFGWNLVEGDKNTKLFTCALNKQISSSFGQGILADLLVENIHVDDFDALAIPGGFEEYGFYQDAYDERFLDLIRAFHKQNKPIASVCVAALPLAKSGVLKNKQATSYVTRRKSLEEFGVVLSNEPLVIDSNLITSYNPETAIKVAFRLLQMLTGKTNTHRVKELMGFA